ncbi:MAG TPA: cupin domain-containing protein [Puia sp.]|nr:cupin domain-containing protein [Puia sp.]
MKRRRFLHSTLTTLAAATVPLPAFPNERQHHMAFKVNTLETRFTERIVASGAPIDFKLLSSDTEDRLSIFISTHNQKGFGPPLHVHYAFDEFFCVLDGNFRFQVDDEILSLATGDTLFIPRSVKHCFTYSGETSGSLLVGMSPGKGMESFFLKMGKLLTGPGEPDMKAMQELFKDYRSEILGPPMKG